MFWAEDFPIRCVGGTRRARAQQVLNAMMNFVRTFNFARHIGCLRKILIVLAPTA
jgi:hypothetical protein